ncbi:GmrSD restriction endonuclease domain-containing protein [Cellulomonas septica]|uniref:DUF262 domain-containing protein n=1 Tax=Cellulomonas septica TaxID=285080 RepID=A0ABX1JWE6_9CELL|nr:DUF262 domain-containing protein [Cellulomonas septica]
MSDRAPAQVELVIDSDDELDGDYEDPGALTPDAVTGSVVYTVDWTVASVVDQIDADPDDPTSQGVLVTAPPFQRRTAWTDERQGLFIESLMLGLPIPPLVLAESMRHEGQFYVLDGKQRLTALQRFFDKNDPLRLRGLEILKTELAGATLAEIQNSGDLRKYARALSTQPIRTVVVRNWKTPSLLHLIFSRLNKASVPLASHELRQAIFPGRLTNFVNKTSGTSAPLLRARRLTEPDFRLRDAETLLRYTAFRTNVSKYSGDLRDFLDRVLKGGNEHYEEIESDLTNLVLGMERAIDATFEIFGNAAFLRFDPERGQYLPRFNVAVFDTITWYLADETLAHSAVARKQSVVEAFETLCTNDPVFSSYLTATTKTKDATIGRLSRWGTALGDALGVKLQYENFVTPFLPIAPRQH